MPRKKSSSEESLKINPETLNEFLAQLLTQHLKDYMGKKTESATQQPSRRGRKKRELRVGFNLLIPYKLYAQLRSYVDYYADKGETITSIILAGLEKELQERFQKKLTQRGITQ